MFRDQRRYGRDPEAVTRAAPATFRAPISWVEGRRVFTCSWSDFFHPDADAWRDEAWGIIAATQRHTYQILTKRPNRIKACLPPDWGDGYPNVWLGTSVESDIYGYRAQQLATVPARVRFLSCEPLLGPLTHLSWWLARGRIQWVIVGGESGGPPDRALVERCRKWGSGQPLVAPCNDCGECLGTGYRPKQRALEWVRTIRDQCLAAGVPLHFKQWGGPQPTSGGRLLDSIEWNGFPDPGPPPGFVPLRVVEEFGGPRDALAGLV